MGPASKTPVKSAAQHSSGNISLLPENSELLRLMFDSFPDSLLLVEEQQIVLAGATCAKLFGFEDPSEFAAQPLDNLVFLDRRFCRDMLESRAAGACQDPSCQQTIRRRNGEEVRVDAHCTHFRLGERDLLLIVLRESSRIEMVRTARNDHLRFRTIFERAGIGIGTSTLDGRIIEANPAFTKMLGYSAEEFSGMHASELHPGDFQPDEQLLLELMEGRQESYQLDKRFRRKDGTYIWGHLTVSLMRDSRRDPAFLIAMVEDTTARRRAEEKLREAEKMEVIGKLAGGVAHDFNNILTGILLYCDLLLSSIPAESPFRAQVQEIRIAGEQGAALTQQLLQISRKQTPQPRPLDINEVLASTQNLLRRLMGEQIELIVVPGADLGVVFADPAQVRQVILNLTLNARDAMPHGGRITIKTESNFIAASNQAAVALVVEDNGSGMDAETRAHLFEPFFTTKKEGQGTGLGLATVHRIVTEAGGEILVESELGRGTSIEVLLPVMQASPKTAAETNRCAGKGRCGKGFSS